VDLVLTNESVRVADTLTPRLTPLVLNLSESVRVADTKTVEVFTVNVSGADVQAVLTTLAAHLDSGPTPGGTLTINGVALGSYDYRVVTGNVVVTPPFVASDWFTPTADSRSAWIVVKGDLTIAAAPAAPAAPTFVAQPGSGGAVYVVGDQYEWEYSYSRSTSSADTTQETLASSSVSWIATLTSGFHNGADLRLWHTTDTTVKWLKVYQRHNGGAWQLVRAIANAGIDSQVQALFDGSESLGAAPPVMVFTPAVRKLFTVISVRGTLTVNGEISMSARGANHSATGSNLAAGEIRIITATVDSVVNPSVPAAGAAGGAGPAGAGQVGGTGGAGATGGGGQGASNAVAGSQGAAGTAFSGGTGGGGQYSNSPTANIHPGATSGGAGGAAAADSYTASGGAGNPGGAAVNVVGLSLAGKDGTGGTLIILVDGPYTGSGAVTAKGADGGQVLNTGSGSTSGGGSGGGSISILAGTTTGPTPSAAGGLAGTGASAASGAAGGAGTARVLYLPGTLSRALTEAARASDTITAQNLGYPVTASLAGEAIRARETISVTRFTVGATNADVYIDGVNVTLLVDIYSISIDDQANEESNTCSFEYWGPRPARDAVVQVYDLTTLAFAGRITRKSTIRQRAEEGRPTWSITATDWTKDLAGVLITDRFLSQSATTSALAIMALAPAGFTTVHVEANLPIIDDIQFTMTPIPSALRQLCDRFGGDLFVEYDKDLHLGFLTSEARAATLTPANHDWRALHYADDDDSAVNQVFVEGMSTNVAADETSAGETRLPIDDATQFSETGGLALIVGRAKATYTGKVEGGGGTLVGVGKAPTTAPTLTLLSGGTLPNGTYGYAFTDKTAAGETVPGPVAYITVGPLAAPTYVTLNPTTSPYEIVDEWNGWDVGNTVEACYTYVRADGTSSARSPIASSVAIANSVGAWYHSPSHLSPLGFTLVAYNSNDPLVTSIIFYHRVISGADVGQWNKWVGFVHTNSPGAGAFFVTLGNPGPYVNYADPPTTTPAYNQVGVADVAVGPTGTTQRKVYRTGVNASQLKLLTTLADNLTTVYTPDTALDATLGANAPTVDDAGLPGVTGTVLAGVTSIPVGSAGQFLTAGGWAEIGSMRVRYTSKTSTSIEGVPASGVGSLAASVNYGATIRALPMLTGIPASGAGSIPALTSADEVAILVQVDDLVDQASRGLVRSRYLADRRLSPAGARERGLAELTLFAPARIEASYTTEDRAVRSGIRVAVALPSPLPDDVIDADAPAGCWRLGDTPVYAAAARVLSAGASAFWRFEEASGVVFADSAGAHTATAPNATGLTYRAPSNLADGSRALAADGSQSAATIVPIASGTTFTVECWYKATGGWGWHPLFTDVSDSYGLFYFDAAQHFYFYDSAGGHPTTATQTTGTWYHVAVVVTAGVGQIYINGVADGPTFAVAAFSFVNLNSGSPGTIDDLAYYSVALSASELAAQYALRTATETAEDEAHAQATHDGTCSAGVLLGQPGPLADGDTAAFFDGTGGISFAGGTLDLTAGPVTVEAWVKRYDGVGISNAAIAGNTYTNGFLLVWHLAGVVYWYCGGNGSVGYASVNVSSDGWHHIVGTWDGNNAGGRLIYVDGVLAPGQAQVDGVSPVMSATGFKIGQSGGGQFFHGTLKDVVVYRSVLTPAQVAAHYAARLVRAQENRFVMAGEWPIQQVRTYFDSSYLRAQRDVTFGTPTSTDLYRILRALQRATVG